MKRNSLIWRLVIIAHLCVLVLAGCTSNSTGNNSTAAPTTKSSSVPISGGTITVALGADFTSLDAYKAGGGSDRIPLFHTQETLVTIDDDSNIVPMLAKEWEMLDNGATYRFKLRQGVKFHNGKEMTAEDVEYSVKRFVEVSSRKGEIPIKKITIEDPYTIKLELTQTNGGFLAALANPFFPLVILPKGLAEEQGGTIKNPIGTGPYQFVEWVPGQSLKLKKYNDYKPLEGATEMTGFGGKKVAYADEIVFRIISDTAVRLNALKSGEVNFISDVSPNQFKELDSKIQTYNSLSLGFGLIEMGLKKPPLDNQVLRKAIAFAVNTEEITNVALYGTAKPVTSIVSSQQKSWFTDVHKTVNAFNPEKAKELIKQSGYKNEKIVISASKAFQHHERTAVLLQQQLKAVGLNVEVEFMDWATLISSRRNTGDYNIFITHATPRPDPLSIYYTELYSKSTARGFNSPAADAILDKAMNSGDTQVRKQAMEDLHKVIIDEVPLITTYAVPTLEASQGIDGYKGWAFAYPRFWNVQLKK